jgi:Flp pilus assembly protein TadG
MKALRSRRGQALVEFGLVGPMFFLLLLGILDLGRAGFFFVVGSNLAREGARYAATYNNGAPGLSAAAVASMVQQQANADGILSANFSIPAACGTATPPKPPTALSACQTPAVDHMFFFIEDVAGSPHYKKVSTVYAFRPITPLVSNVTGTIYIVATSAMTVEY